MPWGDGAAGLRRQRGTMERAGWRALVALLALAMAGAEETGRWRYGSISWRRKDPSNATSYKVIFTIESAWRYSHGSMVKFGTDQKVEAGDTVKILASEGQDPLFAFGDGNVTARYDVEVVKVDTLQDIVVGTSSFEWDYWMAGPWDATLTLCCRVGENQNGMKSVMLRSKVDLSAASVLGSPRVRIVPRVALQATGAGDIAVFEIPTTAAEGFDARSGIVYEAADANFWYSIISNPPNASIFLGVNASSGLASVDVRCYRWGGCSRDLNVIVVVKRQGAWGMVDFVVRVQKNVAGGDAVPMLTLKAPNSIELQGRETSVLRGMPVIKAFADFSVALTFKGQDAMQQPVYFEYNMLPAGAVIGARTLINPLDQVWAQDITWKPSQSQVWHRSPLLVSVSTPVHPGPRVARLRAQHEQEWGWRSVSCPHSELALTWREFMLTRAGRGALHLRRHLRWRPCRPVRCLHPGCSKRRDLVRAPHAHLASEH